MTRIDFYVLPDAEPAGRLRAACRLAAKAWQQDLWTFIRCSDAKQCEELDTLLWRFRPERFIPHNLQTDAPEAPVVLGLEEAPARDGGLLINLAGDISAHVGRFSRVIEIVNQAPEALARSRDNFRRYRQRGLDPRRLEL